VSAGTEGASAIFFQKLRVLRDEMDTRLQITILPDRFGYLEASAGDVQQPNAHIH